MPFAIFSTAFTIAGAYYGGPIGAYLGGQLGSLLDRQIFGGDTTEGPVPRSADFTDASYGKPLPIIFGKNIVAGQIVDHNLTVGRNQQTVDGERYVTYFLRGPVVYMLGEFEAQTIGRIWANNELIYGAVPSDIPNAADIDEPPDPPPIREQDIEFYQGRDDQGPSPTIQTWRGADTPGWPGYCYVVINFESLEKWGNIPPRLDFEMIAKDRFLDTSSHSSGTAPLSAGPVIYTRPTDGFELVAATPIPTITALGRVATITDKVAVIQSLQADDDSDYFSLWLVIWDVAKDRVDSAIPIRWNVSTSPITDRVAPLTNLYEINTGGVVPDTSNVCWTDWEYNGLAQPVITYTYISAVIDGFLCTFSHETGYAQWVALAAGGPVVEMAVTRGSNLNAAVLRSTSGSRFYPTSIDFYGNLVGTLFATHAVTTYGAGALQELEAGLVGWISWPGFGDYSQYVIIQAGEPGINYVPIPTSQVPVHASDTAQTVSGVYWERHWYIAAAPGTGDARTLYKVSPAGAAVASINPFGGIDKASFGRVAFGAVDDTGEVWLEEASGAQVRVNLRTMAVTGLSFASEAARTAFFTSYPSTDAALVVYPIAGQFFEAGRWVGNAGAVYSGETSGVNGAFASMYPSSNTSALREYNVYYPAADLIAGASIPGVSVEAVVGSGIEFELFIGGIHTDRRSVLDTLSAWGALHYFAVVQIGAEVRFRSLLAIDAWTIPQADLAAHQDGDEQPDDYTIRIKNPLGRPGRIDVEFIDRFMDYERNSTYWERRLNNSASETITVPAVYNGEQQPREAARFSVAERAYEAEIEFRVPWKYLGTIQPGDNGTLQSQHGNVRVRVEQVTFESTGVMIVRGRRIAETPVMGIHLDDLDYADSTTASGSARSVSIVGGTSTAAVSNGDVTIAIAVIK